MISSYTFKIQIFTQAHHLFDLSLYNSVLIISSLVCFDLRYQFFNCTCSLSRTLLGLSNSSQVIGLSLQTDILTYNFQKLLPPYSNTFPVASLSIFLITIIHLLHSTIHTFSHRNTFPRSLNLRATTYIILPTFYHIPKDSFDICLIY